jgi:hypothetical protein
MAYTSNYQQVGGGQNYLPDYNNLDLFVFRLLNDIATQSTLQQTLNGTTGNLFANTLVAESYSDINVQEQRNASGIKNIIAFARDDADPRNDDGSDLAGNTFTTQIAYFIYANVSNQEGSKTAKKRLNKLLDGLTKELKSTYTYQTTVNGIVYSAPLQQNSIFGRAEVFDTINDINYLTGVLSCLFKITKN